MYFSKLVAAYDAQRRERNIYHDLMRFRVREVLLVGSLYDSFVVESDGVLTEQIYGEYFKLNLNTIPRVTCAYTAGSALDLFREGKCDLVILMAGLDYDDSLKLASEMKRIWPDIPVLLMATNNSCLERLDPDAPGLESIDRVFVWNGYSRLFVGMIKYVEDLRNVEADTKAGQVRVILLIEDSIRYYSRYLPLLYKVVLKQTQNLVEGEMINETYKLLSIRARPKILLASTWEQAKKVFDTYESNLLTVITDLRFPRNGAIDETAGFDFLSMAREKIPDLPILVQSAEPRIRQRAYDMGASFADKNSESLEMELEQFLQRDLGFGAFRFRAPSGEEIARAGNMAEFIDRIHSIPPESLVYHAERNHFSAWLMARGEIQMARILKPYKVGDFGSLMEMRNFIVKSIDDARREKSKGIVPAFDPGFLMEEDSVSRIADGSVGGKGRGIVFIRSLLDNLDFSGYIGGIDVKIPRSVFIGTDEFESFLESHDLWASAFYGQRSEDLRKCFLSMPLSGSLVSKLREFLALTDKPLAVRSSGLFEDMMMVPFSGIYDTYILPDNHPDPEARLTQVCDAIRLIYASLFSEEARTCFESSRYSLEEERMGVIIQELVGSRHGDFFYPSVSGVAQSFNYYPVSSAKPEDGICLAALGLGTWVVGGGAAHAFCPRYPKIDMPAPDSALDNTQRFFHALDMRNPLPDLYAGQLASLAELPISAAAGERFFPLVASTWDREDMRLVPGASGKGPCVIDLGNILKNDALPFAGAISMALDVGSRSMGAPVEIEYALNLDEKGGKPALYILQLKPLIRAEEKIEIEFPEGSGDGCFAYSAIAMGNGRDQGVRDIIWVDPLRFDRSRTLETAAEIGEMDREARKLGKRYALFGPGRWGTRDRWLGIPVSFSQISGARIIAEYDLPDFVVDSSMGSHFFHNLTGMGIGYMKIPLGTGQGYVDWDWLRAQPETGRSAHCVWTCLGKPLDLRMDGRAGKAILLKPEHGA